MNAIRLAIVLGGGILTLTHPLNAQNIWLRQGGGQANDEALAISRCGNDHVVTTGYFNQSASFWGTSFSSAGLRDVMVNKLNANGTAEWSVRMGGPQGDFGSAIACDSQGNIFVAGSFSATAQFGPVSLTALGDSTDVFIAKLNAAGEVQWARRCGGSGADRAGGIHVNAAGEVVVAGQFRAVADFGATSFTSTGYDYGSEPSLDGFIAKLSTNGDWIWAKQAAAPDDVILTGLTHDATNNIYFCGQFGDDLTVDVLHPNTVENAGLLMKLNAAGNEQWFTKFGAVNVDPTGIALTSDNHIVVGGDFIGQLTVTHTATSTFPVPSGDHIFGARFNLNGQMQWLTKYRSDNEIKATSIAAGSNGECYLAGNFRCSFTDLAEQLGEQAFFSMGFRDIFTLRLNSVGNSPWQRHFAGPRDVLANGAAFAAGERVMLAGGFQYALNVPAGTNYTSYAPDNTVPESVPAPNTGFANCGYDDYGTFLRVIHAGGVLNTTREMFVTSCYSTEAPLLDYVLRGVGQCDFSFPELCAYPVPDCVEELENCFNLPIAFELYLNVNLSSGPSVNIQWSSNVPNPLNPTTGGTGIYTLDVMRLDGCMTYSDDFSFTLLPNPPPPLITDNQGVNNAVSSTTEVITCEEDVVVSATACPTCTVEWSGFGTSTATISETGLHFAIATDEFGCTTGSFINITIDSDLTLDDPTDLQVIPFFAANDISGDTIIICNNTEIFPIVLPDPAYFTDPDYIGTYEGVLSYEIYLNGELYYSNENYNDWTAPFLITEAGHYEMYVYIADSLENACGDWSQDIGPLYNSFWVELYDTPPNNFSWFADPPILCPGDTSTVYLTGATTYFFSEGQVLEIINDSTFTVNEGVFFPVQGQTESAEGCVNSVTQFVDIVMVAQPEATLLPSDGVVCPGEFVELTTTPGEAYSWVGPGGNIVSTEQTFTTNQPGQYSCIVEIGQCVIESNIVTIAQYFEPYILYLPEPDPCELTPVNVEIVTPFPEGVTWDPQLNFTGVSGIITDYGSYTVEAIACGIATQIEIILPVSNLEATIAAAQPALCIGEETTVTAITNGSDITWSTGATDVTSITVNTTGTYSFSAVDELGCTATASVLVQVFDPQPPITAPNAVACFNEPLTLSADADFNIYWTSDAAGEDVLANGATYLIPAVDGAFSVYVFHQQQTCVSEPVLVSVEVSSASLPVELTSGDSLCLGGNFNLAVANPVVDSYLWQTASGESVSGGTTFTIENAEFSDSGWYTATAQDEFCTSSADSVLVEVFTPEEQSLSFAPEALCEGDVLTLFAPLEASSYTWTTPSGFYTGPDLVVANISQADAGDYLLSVSGAACAYVFSPYNLFIGSYPNFELDADLPECVGPALRLTVDGDFDELLWSTGDTDSQIWVIEPGVFSLTATNYPGCATTRDIEIVEIDCGEDFFNVFTPNYDGVNDYVDFALHPVKFQRVYIYNRWGTLVTTLQAPRLEWYGTSSSGEALSDGVYYWVGQGAMKELHGSIYIRR